MNEYPHDPNAFTQGLDYDQKCKDGTCTSIFYESTGLYGASTVREVDLATGNVTQKRSNPDNDFAEGLTRIGDRLYQVTWKSGKGYSYSVNNFDDVKQIQVSKGPINRADFSVFVCSLNYFPNVYYLFADPS